MKKEIESALTALNEVNRVSIPKALNEQCLNCKNTFGVHRGDLCPGGGKLKLRRDIIKIVK